MIKERAQGENAKLMVMVGRRRGADDGRNGDAGDTERGEADTGEGETEKRMSERKERRKTERKESVGRIRGG